MDADARCPSFSTASAFLVRSDLHWVGGGANCQFAAADLFVLVRNTYRPVMCYTWVDGTT